MGQVTNADVPRLLEELRGLIQSKLRRPVDPDIDFLTTQIEVASMHYTEPTFEGSEWASYGLTPNEAKLASFLKSRLGKPTSTQAMMNALYGSSEWPGHDVIGVYTCKINKKIAGSGFMIEGVHTFGKRMVLGTHQSRACSSERVEWREGIFMGPQQARIAQVLFDKLGYWIRSGDLQQRAAVKTVLAPQIWAIRKNLNNSRFHIENQRRYGYRMVLRSNAQRAA